MSRSFRYHRISAGLIILLLGVLACSKAVTDSQDIPESPPVTGIGLESFDRIITGIMGEYAIPGGSLAVVKDGRLVVARGYGYSDVDAGEPVQPESLFRICSITKPVTAVTVMKLVEEGLLDLDSPAFPYLDHLSGPPGTTPDPRLATITIRRLLNHSGGWDREESFDPMFIPVTAAQAIGETPPADAETVIRYMLGQPLDFDPGTRYAYSNFGYNVLGRIIEQVTSREYEEYVKEHVLAPAGITRMQKGRTLLEDRAEGEVLYYHYPGAGLASSVFPELPGEVLWPYGGFHLEAMDSHGAWIGSAIDLVRFTTAVDLHASRPDILQEESIREMIERPGPPLWQDSAYYYALGWLVRPITGEANWWHTGGLPGSRTILVRTYHGMAWAALFNMRPKGPSDFINDIDRGIWEAVGEVVQWPSHDLFDQYP